MKLPLYFEMIQKILLSTIKIIVIVFMSSSIYSASIAISIKPIYSLVKELTLGVDDVKLILDTNNTPHEIEITYQQQKMINDSDLLIIVSKDFEREILNGRKNKATIILEDLAFNEMYPFSMESFMNFQDSKNNNNASNKKHLDSNNHKKHKSHDHHDAENMVDYHFWLDINKNIIVLDKLKDLLIKNNPQAKDKYLANYALLKEKLLQLNVQIKNTLNTKQIANFMVYHNGWQYFIKSYDLPFMGNIVAIDNHHDSLLSVKALLVLEKYLTNNSIKCIFIEPQFDDNVLLSFIQNKNILYYTIDPIGNNLDINDNLYSKLMLNNAKSIAQCIK